MPSVDTRLALMEQRLDEIHALINSGPGVSWDQSIRGRLHRVTTSLDTADKLAEALREVRRERARRWTTGERVAMFGFAAVATVTPYALLLLGR